MKRIKKLAALMMAAIMVLAMSVTAFATQTPATRTLTINNPTEGHTYTAYQILTGTLAENGQLTGLDWGDGISEAGKTALRKHLKVADNASAAVVAEALSKITEAAPMDAVAQILGDGKTGNGTPLTATADGKVSTSVAQGYYVIVDTLTDSSETTETSMSKYMVQVVGDVAINTKAEETTRQKTVQEANDARAKFAEANIGEVKTFYLVGTLPADYAAYDAFYMMFNDTMNRMDYVGLTSVEVKRGLEADDKGVLDPTTETAELIATISAQNGNDAINGYRLTAPQAPADGTVTDTLRNTLSVEFIDLKQICSDAVAGDSVVITYQAKLNSTAMVNAANVNEFDLKFSNDPNNTTVPHEPNTTPNIPTGVTPKDEADLYTTEIELTKRDGTTGDILTGAEFTLTGETNNVRIETKEMFVEAADGTYYKLVNGGYTTNAPTEDTTEYYADTTKKYTLTVTTNVLQNAGDTEIKAYVGSDGILKFSGLGAGKYKLEETQVPTGYNKMDDIEFEISFDTTSKSFTGTNVFEDGLAADINNLSGSTLPSTGGIGTTIFYVVGAILVIGAGVILVTKKRMSKEV